MGRERTSPPAGSGVQGRPHSPPSAWPGDLRRARLDIHFEVADMCALGRLLAGREPPYDLIVDSHCLQSVVTDEDGRSLAPSAAPAKRLLLGLHRDV
jgi:hypothetical protein